MSGLKRCFFNFESGFKGTQLFLKKHLIHTL